MDALASRLCRECALCCDGTLFARVPLADQEVPRPELQARANPAGGRFVPQPCAALGKDGCTCYSARPQACRQYRCVLVSACVEGEVSLRDALRTVSRARDWADEDDAAAREDFYSFTFGRR